GLIDTLLGSFTGPGGVSALAYAQLVQVLPISLFGASVTAVSLPELSRDAAGAAPNEQLRARIALGFRRIVFFVVPSSIAFIALGSSIGAFVNTTLHLRDLSARIGNVLRGADWRAFGIALLGALVAGAASVGSSRLAVGVAPVPRGVVVLGIFGIVYAALTLA